MHSSQIFVNFVAYLNIGGVMINTEKIAPTGDGFQVLWDSMQIHMYLLSHTGKNTINQAHKYLIKHSALTKLNRSLKTKFINTYYHDNTRLKIESGVG